MIDSTRAFNGAICSPSQSTFVALVFQSLWTPAALSYTQIASPGFATNGVAYDFVANTTPCVTVLYRPSRVEVRIDTSDAAGAFTSRDRWAFVPVNVRSYDPIPAPVT